MGPEPTRNASPGSVMATSYDASFYEEFTGLSQRSASVLIPLLLHTLPMRSALDVGCGQGFFLAELQRQGIDDILGIEGDWARSVPLRISRELYRFADLRTAVDIGRSFDLVLCLEVAEHLEREWADTIVETLTRHGSAICFSAAVPGQGGTHHVNERWPDYWARKFRQRDYDPFDAIRPRVFKDERVADYYAQNLLLYARRGSGAHRHLSQTSPPLDGRIPFRIATRLSQTGHPLGTRILSAANRLPGTRTREAMYHGSQILRARLSRRGK